MCIVPTQTTYFDKDPSVGLVESDLPPQDGHQLRIGDLDDLDKLGEDGVLVDGDHGDGGPRVGDDLGGGELGLGHHVVGPETLLQLDLLRLVVGRSRGAVVVVVLAGRGGVEPEEWPVDVTLTLTSMAEEVALKAELCD